MKKLYLIGLAISQLFIYNVSNAQKNCGNNNAEKDLYEQNPYLKQYQEAYDLEHNYLETPQEKSSERKYIIPIVFHILHDYGTENISDDQVYDQIRILNEDYNKLNEDTISVWSEFDSIIGNCNIEFRLAQLDPQGKPTNGIDRIPSKLTYGAPSGSNDNAKLNAWPRYKYINVWVVKNMINGVAGYAYRPASVPYVDVNSKKIDGIIILQDYIGSIGTSSPGYSRALTHEIGHYLNLQHTWGGTNEPGIACGDDGVTDTPGTKGWKTCPSNKNSTKICTSFRIENIQNFMEYSYCSKMFTNGQKLAMRNALNSDVAERDILWSDSNLAAAGVADGMYLGGQKPLKADFSASKFFVCAGKVISLTDMSWNGTVENRTWEIADGESDDTNIDKTNVKFSTEGIKKVTLNVSNTLGSATASKNIYVSGDEATYYGFIGEAFPVSNVLDDKLDRWIPNHYSSQKSYFGFTNKTGNFGKGALFINGYESINGEISEVISPAFNMGYISSAQLNFYYSFATKTSNPQQMTDVFKVFYSTDCGGSWILLKTKTGAELACAGMHDDDYIPVQSEWLKETITIPLALAQKNIRFKFQFTASTNANNFYLDDVNIEGVVGLSEIASTTDILSIYPNPISNTSTIKFNNIAESNTKITLVDIVGKEVAVISDSMLSSGIHEFELNSENLSNGMYIVKIQSNNNLFLQKVAVNK